MIIQLQFTETNHVDGGYNCDAKYQNLNWGYAIDAGSCTSVICVYDEGVSANYPGCKRSSGAWSYNATFDSYVCSTNADACGFIVCQ